MAVQGCFAAHVVPSLPLEKWNLSTQQLVLGREQRGQTGTLVSSSMETLIFTRGRENLGLGPGFVIGLGAPWDGETNLQPQHFTRNPWSERNQCCEFSDSEGWQDISSAQTWGHSSESPSQQEFWAPGEVWIPPGSSCLGG